MAALGEPVRLERGEAEGSEGGRVGRAASRTGAAVCTRAQREGAPKRFAAGFSLRGCFERPVSGEKAFRQLERPRKCLLSRGEGSLSGLSRVSLPPSTPQLRPPLHLWLAARQQPLCAPARARAPFSARVCGFPQVVLSCALLFFSSLLNCCCRPKEHVAPPPPRPRMQRNGTTECKHLKSLSLAVHV